VPAIIPTQAAVNGLLAGEMLPLARIQRIVVQGAATSIGQASICLLHLPQTLRQVGARLRQIGMMALGQAGEGGAQLRRRCLPGNAQHLVIVEAH
jgi:hypothetical protein